MKLRRFIRLVGIGGLMLVGALLSGAASGQPLTVGLLAGAGGLGDESFNDMLYAGLGKAQKLYQFKLIFEETDSSQRSEADGMRRLVARGADVIFANGANFAPLVDQYAERYPRKRFVISDDPSIRRPNVAAMVFQAHEGSFLAGALAAWMTRSGQVGFIGGVDTAPVQSFRLGFEEGVSHANPAVRLDVRFVTRGEDYTGFSDPTRGAEMAAEMYTSGVDIIFSVAGLTGNGVIRAAQRAGKFVIGVDADQDHMAKGYVLTSMMKRLDRAAFLEVTRVVQGEFKAGVSYYSLANGGVRLSPMRYTYDRIPDRIHEALKATQAKIISGEIKVSNYLDADGSGDP